MGVQALGQHHGRSGVGRQVGVQRGIAKGLGGVVLEGAGAVDHCVHRAKARRHGGPQGANRTFIGQVGKKCIKNAIST